MNKPLLSADAEVILLLCGRFGGERQESFPPLTARDYGELARWLSDRNLRPADLLADAGRTQLSEIHLAKLERKRVDFLLERGTALALALERWNRSGLWVISRGDPEFPKRLKRQLKHAAPPLLYGTGQKELLDMGGLAIVGSRDATETALEFTREIAAQCARERIGVVSGGARGVDTAAMQGATEAGGCTIGVLANDLLKASVNRQNRAGLQEGRLVLLSPFYPEAHFNAGNAMSRNKLIYALADYALVIDSALNGGGTWEGALEALNQKWIPLYVRIPGHRPGNAALVEKGGIPFNYQAGYGQLLADFFSSEEANRFRASEPKVAHSSLLDPVRESANLAPIQDTTPECGEELRVAAAPVSMPDATMSLITSVESSAPSESGAAQTLGPPPVAVTTASLDMYQEFVNKLSRALVSEALTDEQVATTFGLETSQAKVWLKRAHNEGRVEKLKRPVRYSLSLQSSLLG